MTMSSPGFVSKLVKVMHETLLGEPLQRMNANALGHVADAVNDIGATFETDSLYLWFRNTMTMVVTNGLLGAHNPLIADPSLIDSLWYANHTSQVWAILTSLGTSRKEFWYFSSEYSHHTSHPKLIEAVLPSSQCLVHTTPPSTI